MRLVCPNCAAQYEVDASLLPSEGSEVQCAACSTVWFQPGPDTPKPPPETPRPPPARAERPRPRSDARPTEPEAPAPAPAPAQPPRPQPEPAEDTVPDAADPPARPLDPSVAEVLREEAAFEAQQRAREETPLETQQELGLFGPIGTNDAVPHKAGGASSLPDIDDISSTLEPIDSGRYGQSGLPQTEAARKRSFLTGMGIPLGVAALLVGVYMLAPTLAAAVPALEGPLSSFVSLVDQARRAVAALLGGVL